MRSEQLIGRGQIMFQVIGTIIFGAIIGVLARIVIPGKQAYGWIVTVLLGVAGALIGYWVWGLLVGDQRSWGGDLEFCVHGDHTQKQKRDRDHIGSLRSAVEPVTAVAASRFSHRLTHALTVARPGCGYRRCISSSGSSSTSWSHVGQYHLASRGVPHAV